MERVEAFMAIDGTIYATEEQCKDHETLLKIEEFCNSEFCGNGQRGANNKWIQKVVIGWEKFNLKQGVGK